MVLGQVVMTDFTRAQVLDRLLVYERRIENSLYRTMAQLRKEREARIATAEPEEVSRSEGDLAAGQESAAPAELGSFGVHAVSEEGANAKIMPDGVTTNLPAGENHGRDARATRTPCGVATSDEGRATRAPAETLHDRSCETNPTAEERAIG